MANSIDDLIDKAQDFSKDAADAASKMLNEAILETKGSFNPQTPNLSYTPVSFAPDALPSFEADINFDGYGGSQELPERPNFLVARLPEIPDIPFFSGERPFIGFTVAPQALSEFQGQAPQVELPDNMPQEVGLFYPAAPKIREYEGREVAAPDVPDYNAELPEVGGSLDLGQDLDDVADLQFERMIPELQSFVNEEVQSMIAQFSPQSAPIYEKLDSQVLDAISGTGTHRRIMPEAVEQKLLDQAYQRISDARQESAEQLSKDLQKTGFPIPPGLLGHAMIKIQTEGLKAAVAAVRDAYLQVHEREAQHFQAMLQLASDNRDQARQSVIAYIGALLDAQKFALDKVTRIADLGAKMYNLKVEQYRTKHEFFRLQIEDWETRMKVALADLEIHKIELEAEQEKTNVTKIASEVYQTQVAAEKAKVDNYAAQVSAVVSRAAMEKLRIEAFGETVKAYSAQAESKKYEFEAYRAAIAGDAAKVDIYSAQVAAYRAETEASAVIARSEKDIADAITAHNRSLGEVYEADLRRYVAEGDQGLKAIEVTATAYRATLEGYKAQLLQASESNKLKLQQEEIQVKAALGTLEAEVAAYKVRAQMHLTEMQVSSNAGIEAARVMGSTAQAALAGQTTMVQLYSEQDQ